MNASKTYTNTKPIFKFSFTPGIHGEKAGVFILTVVERHGASPGLTPQATRGRKNLKGGSTMSDEKIIDGKLALIAIWRYKNDKAIQSRFKNVVEYYDWLRVNITIQDVSE